RAQRGAGEVSEGTMLTPGAGPSVLVVTADAAGALAVADAAQPLLGERGATFIPVTSVGRATRQLRASSPLGVSGSAAVLAELVRNAVLKLDRVQAVILAWGDDILATGGATELE